METSKATKDRPESMLLSQPSLTIEAAEVVKEVSYAVQHVELSTRLPQSDTQIYLNLETKENISYCVELSLKGFKIVSNAFNEIDSDVEARAKYYETIYSLLDAVSPQYRNSFGETLMGKLSELQSQQET